MLQAGKSKIKVLASCNDLFAVSLYGGREKDQGTNTHSRRAKESESKLAGPSCSNNPLMWVETS